MNPLANNIYSLGTVGYLNKNKYRPTILGVMLLGLKIYFNPYSVICYVLSPHNQRDGPKPAIIGVRRKS